MSKAGENSNESISGIPQDWDAFCSFIESHYGLIYSVSLAHTRDAEIAQEITQDVCVRLLLDQKKLSQIPNPAGWLVLVARNTAVDWGRRRQRHSRILAMMESWNYDTTKAGHNPADARTAAANEEEKQRLYAALEHIAPEDREIILLHYLDGVEKQEIARLLALHPSTVGRRIDRARRQLKTSLGDADHELPVLSDLRLAAHTSRSVIATLGAVAALSAADKAALASVAAPLPILSATVAAETTFAGVVVKALSKAGSSITNPFSGWAIPAIAGVLLLGVATIRPWNYINETHMNSPAQISAIGLPDQQLQTLKSANQSARSRQTNQHPKIMNGLTSTGANSPGFLYPSTDGKTVYGNVTNVAGEPIAGAEVTLYTGRLNSDKATSHSLLSDAAGRFVFHDINPDLQGGLYAIAYLTATAQGYAHATYGEYEVLLPLPKIREDINIRLERPVKQAGLVTDESGSPLTGAKIAVEYEYDRHQKRYQDDNFRQQIFVTTSDENGHYTFDQLKPGYVALKVEHPNYNYAPFVSDPLESSDQSVKLKLEKGVTLAGTVHDGQTTLSNFLVEINGSFLGLRAGDTIDLQTDKNGEFKIDHISIPDPTRNWWPYTIKLELPKSQYWLVYHLELKRGELPTTLALNLRDPRAIPTIWPKFFWVQNNQDDTSSSEKSAVGRATVTAVVDAGLNDLPEKVSLTLSDNKSFYIDRNSTKAGTFVFSGIHPGEYMLSCTFDVDGGSYSMRPVMIKVVENDHQTVILKRTGTSKVYGRIAGLTPGTTSTVSVLAHNENPLWQGGPLRTVATVNTSVNGLYEINGLPAGDYVLTARDLPTIGNKVFSCRENESIEVNLSAIPTYRVGGVIIDSSTSTPVANAKISVTYKVSRTTTNKQSLNTDKNGRFETYLTTGTYDLNITVIGTAWTCITTVKIDGEAELPPIDISRATGGIVIHAQGNMGKIAWRQAFVHLFRKSDQTEPVITKSANSCLNIDDNSLILNRVESGTYGVMVRYSHDLDTKPNAFATAFIPNVEVHPDIFTILNVPLEPSPFVHLVCMPGRHLLTWAQPQFWLKDSNGVRLPLDITKSYQISLGLAPGEYTFGVTLDSGEEQSVNFRVTAIDKERQVVLRLN